MPFLHPFIGDYQALASLYGLIRNAYADRPYIDRGVDRQDAGTATAAYGQRSVRATGFYSGIERKHIEGSWEQSDVSDTVKVLNLRKILHKTVTEESRSKPFLISIGERAEALAEAYENRQKSTQEVLAAYEELVEGCERASSEQ